MASSSRQTRQSHASSIVQAAELPQSELPTLKDVLAKMLFERDKLIIATKTKNVEIKSLAESVLPEIKALFRKVNSKLVLNSDRTIILKIVNDYKQMKDIERSGKKGRQREMFESKLGKLFDILSCKCLILDCQEFECAGCEVKAHITCKCSLDQKIPEVELLYVLDQRSRRDGQKGKFQMGGLDTKEVEKMSDEEKVRQKKEENRKKREQALEKAKEKEKERVESEKVVGYDDLDIILGDADLNDNTEEAFVEELGEGREINQNRQNLSNLAMICDRYGVSSRAGAAIANAALTDAGVISATNQTNVIDKCKLRRAIDKYREERKVADQDDLIKAQGEAYYFDGKKDRTLFTSRDENNKQFKYYQEEEHISMSSEPGGKYVTHLTPKGESGAEIVECVVDYLEEHGVSESWRIIGGDSTAGNTGNKRGCFVLIENRLGRRLFRVVCVLHLNELPWRHVFVDIDGPTDSKNTFKGVIGKLLPKVEELEFNNRFKKIDDGPGLPDITEDVAADLSSDQKMLFMTFQSIRTGIIRPELHSLTPGPISHSRWLTHAIRTMLLHMKKHGLQGKDKSNLTKLVHFLMTNYVVMWFTHKQRDTIEEAPRNLLKQVQLTSLLPKDIQTIARKNIDRNSYWAHPENLLLSMLADQDSKIRGEAVDKIIAVRGDRDYGDNHTRKFINPTLNFEAEHYSSMIDWENVTVTEPVLTTSMSSAELLNLRSAPLTLSRYPSHTQSVERLVKQTTRAAETVAGYSARDGFLRASAKSREMMPKFDSKQDFENNFL